MSSRLNHLDRALLDALAARMAVKARQTPDQAAIGLRALLAEAPPGVPSELVRSLWARIEADGISRIGVWGPLSALLGAARFGQGVRPASDPQTALKAARDGGVAVLDIGRSSAWWARLLAEPALRVVGALPDDGSGRPLSLIVGQGAPGPTGDDRTFFVAEAPGPDQRLIDMLAMQGLAAEPLDSAGGLKLVMLAGYVQPGDGRLAVASGGLSGVIGAAPVF